ncbi:hypothetical protein K501DRAFT_271066 [Backusella circina FSU 941]|nr:hypothetical protein K501DRAFT_271066 [Backusella circina FSU 941]
MIFDFQNASLQKINTVFLHYSLNMIDAVPIVVSLELLEKNGVWYFLKVVIKQSAMSGSNLLEYGKPIYPYFILTPSEFNTIYSLESSKSDESDSETSFFGSVQESQDFAWYHKAVLQTHATTQAEIGYMYYLEYGVSKDYKLAMEWYRKAVSMENGIAQLNIGYLYRNRWAVPVDYRVVYEGSQKRTKGCFG